MTAPPPAQPPAQPTRRVGARGSPLSLAQAAEVTGALGLAWPGTSYDVARITTSGDRSQGAGRALFEMDRRGAFEREIDEAVADGRVDFAVHSLKDVPNELPAGLVVACVPKRASAADVLVARNGGGGGGGGGGGLDSLPRGAAVGTSSLRRAVMVRRARPDARVVPVRGNVGTRIARMLEGGGGGGGGAAPRLDALVLARAGIERLGLDVDAADLPADEFVPSPGQGSLAVVARAGDRETLRLVAAVEDRASRAEADAERAVSRSVGSGCRFPVGAHARAEDGGGGGTVSVVAAAFSADGSEAITASESGPAGTAAEVGRRAGESLRSQGVDGLARGWRRMVDEWNRGWAAR